MISVILATVAELTVSLRTRLYVHQIPLAHAIALGIGVVAFFVVLGWQTLTAQAPFLVRPTGDFAAEQASFVLIANDIWRFPFLALPQVNQPEGANAVFFGGTPLLALVARTLKDISGASEAPNLLGFWYFICFALQAHALFFLMRQINRQRPLLLALASSAGIFAYAFLTRFGHVSLFGHFLVIYAMGLVVGALRPEVRWQTTLLALSGITVVAMLIFAYLAVSIGTLFGAALLMLWCNRRMRLSRVISIAGGFAGLLTLVAWSAGYFWSVARAEPVDMSSYSDLGLNIGSLLIPHQSPLFPKQALFRPWWEGDFYLGLGTIALLISGVAARPRAAWLGLVKAWPLVLAFALLTLYSLSNRWAFGSTVFFQYDLPRWAGPIVGLARAGGRLFWPIGYLIIALSFAFTARGYGRMAPLMVVAALTLNGVEAAGPVHAMRRTAFQPVDFPLDYGGLQRVMDAHRNLRLYPTFWCDPGGDGSVKRVVHWQLQITSARAHQNSNSAITVRKMKDCKLEQAGISSETLRPGDLDVFLTYADFMSAFAGHEAEQTAHCRQFDMGAQHGYMCSAAWEANTTLPLAQLHPVEDNYFALSASHLVDFSSNGNSEYFITTGWAQSAEGLFTWTEGPDANIYLPLPNMAHGAKLLFDVYPFAPPKISRRVEVLAGSRILATWTFTDADWTKREVIIPPDLTGTKLHLDLRESEIRSPRELGISNDVRHLGLAVRTIHILELP